MTQAPPVETELHGHVAKYHQERPSLLAVGVLIWLGSEIMFFSGLFAAYFTIRAGASVWPPRGTHLDYVEAGIFTVILLVSSPTFQFGVWSQERGEKYKARVWIVVSFVLGLAFVANTLYEWHDFASRGDGPHANSYWSLFFIMTGIHGLHVVLGLVAMIFLLGRIKGPQGDPGETTVFQSVGYYWHFVDFMWIGIFTCLFLLKTG